MERASGREVRTLRFHNDEMTSVPCHLRKTPMTLTLRKLENHDLYTHPKATVDSFQSFKTISIFVVDLIQGKVSRLDRHWMLSS